MSFSFRWRNKLGAKLFLLGLAVIILTQAFISAYLARNKEKITAAAQAKLGYRLQLDKISFSFINGVHLKGLRIFYDSQPHPVISAQNINLKIRLLPLFLAKVSAHIKIGNLRITAKKEPRGYNYQIITSDMSKRLSDIDARGIKLTFHAITAAIKRSEFIYPDSQNNCLTLEYRATRIILDSYNKLKLNTEIRVHYSIPAEGGMAKFINLYEIHERLKCILHGTLQDKDLNIGLISLAKGKDQIIGTGKIKDFTEANPVFDINFINSTVRLDNIVFLRKAFAAEGNISISLKLYGPMDNTKFIARAQMDNCYFKYKIRPQEVFSVNNAGGIIESDGAQASIRSLTFYDAGGLPYRVNAKITLSQEPQVELGLYLGRDFFAPQNIPLDKLEIGFNGKVSGALTGSLEIKAFYAKTQPGFNIAANLQNIFFDYAGPKEQHFKTDIILIKNNAYLSQKLTLNGFTAVIAKNKDQINITDISLAAYGARLNGSAKLDFRDVKPHFTLKLKGAGLDVKAIMEDTKITNKLLSGDMDTWILFDNRKREFLKGYCRVKNGTVDLNVLASAVKFPSLNLSGFYIMEAFFSCSNDAASVRGVKLYSKDLKFKGFWNISPALKGAVNMAASSQLLSQSPSFRKLLSIADINKPYIDFKFLLAGQPQALRFLWAKGEFKERLEQGIPGWIKRRIQNSLNESINEVAQ